MKRKRGKIATSQIDKMTSQCAVHTHHASVERITGTFQGCTVDKMTAVTAMARKNAIVKFDKRLWVCREDP